MKQQTGKIIAVGDLHGHWTELQELMNKLINEYKVDVDKDTFVFLGDFVDGGPDTKKVIDWLIESKKQHPHWQMLYGNHEDLMLDALNPAHPVYHDYYLWWSQGGRDTTASYLKASGFSDYEKSLANPIHVIPADHIIFLTDLPTYYETEKYFFVHGGVHPYHTIEWAKKNMSRYDMIWERSFINSNFDYEKKIIFGHTIRTSANPKNHLQPWVFPNKIGIDTMAHNTGRLTAVILPDETFVQTDYVWDAQHWNEGIL